MITFYYINRQAINDQYAQIVSFVVESIEKYRATSGKADGKFAFGKWLNALGLDLGGIEIGGELNKESTEKIFLKLSEEQKVFIVWKKLQETSELVVLTDETSEGIEIGSPILFEGMFSIFDGNESEVSRLEGIVGRRKLVTIFSNENMPPSILGSLHHIPAENPLSGYGTVMRADEEEFIVRPIAFGLGFIKALAEVEKTGSGGIRSFYK